MAKQVFGPKLILSLLYPNVVSSLYLYEESRWQQINIIECEITAQNFFLTVPQLGLQPSCTETGIFAMKLSSEDLKNFHPSAYLYLYL